MIVLFIAVSLALFTGACTPAQDLERSRDLGAAPASSPDAGSIASSSRAPEPALSFDSDPEAEEAVYELLMVRYLELAEHARRIEPVAAIESQLVVDEAEELALRGEPGEGAELVRDAIAVLVARGVALPDAGD